MIDPGTLEHRSPADGDEGGVSGRWSLMIPSRGERRGADPLLPATRHSNRTPKRRTRPSRQARDPERPGKSTVPGLLARSCHPRGRIVQCYMRRGLDFFSHVRSEFLTAASTIHSSARHVHKPSGGKLLRLKRRKSRRHRQRHAGKIAKRHQLSGHLVETCQPNQGIVQGNELVRSDRAERVQILEVHPFPVPPSFLAGLPRARSISIRRMASAAAAKK